MARFNYNPYSRQQNQLRWILYLALILVMLVAAFLVIRYRNQKSVLAESSEPLPAESSAEGQTQEPAPEAAPRFEIALKQPTEQPAAEPLAESNPQTPTEAGSESASAGEPVTPENSQAAILITESQADIAAGKIVEARDKLNEALSMALNPQQLDLIKNQLSSLAEKWLFSKNCYKDDKLCQQYQVRTGDVLTEVARRHNVPFEILMQINNIVRPEVLRAGQIIKVINGPFNATVRRSTFTMDIYLQNTYVKTFRVGLGKTARETPTGVWRVKDSGKLVKPTWTDPDTGRVYRGEDPDYPLGSRWIALEGIQGEAKGRTGFAIHGTNKAEEIGSASSRGCIRLHNGDAILAYNLFVPVLSEIKVLD